MATGPGVNQGKTAFLEEFLPGNRDAELNAVNSAWKSAGNQGTISKSLFGKIRAKLGLTGKRPTNGGASRESDGPAAKGKARSSPKRGKPESKAERAPSKPDGREGDTGPNKSEFLRKLLQKNPDLKLEGATEAWRKSGNEGEVSSSLFYRVKRTSAEKAEGGSGISGEAPRRSEPESMPTGQGIRGVGQQAQEAVPDSGGVTAPSQPATGPMPGGRERVLDRVEDGIDDLIVELKQLGGMEEALEALRKVRRVVVRSHEG